MNESVDGACFCMPPVKDELGKNTWNLSDACGLCRQPFCGKSRVSMMKRGKRSLPGSGMQSSSHRAKVKMLFDLHDISSSIFNRRGMNVSPERESEIRCRAPG